MGGFESRWQRTVAPSPCSAEPAFLAAASFGICAITIFASWSRQGIPIGGTECLAVMIRTFNPSRLTSGRTGQSWTRLPAPTASSMQSAFMSSADNKPFTPFTSSRPNGWQLWHAEPEFNGSFMFQESARMPPHHPDTFESAAKANWQSGQHFMMQCSSARR